MEGVTRYSDAALAQRSRLGQVDSLMIACRKSGSEMKGTKHNRWSDAGLRARCRRETCSRHALSVHRVTALGAASSADASAIEARGGWKHTEKDEQLDAHEVRNAVERGPCPPATVLDALAVARPAKLAEHLAEADHGHVERERPMEHLDGTCRHKESAELARFH
eukprot:6175261-Pleurochrysis_carterae.AAC.1